MIREEGKLKKAFRLSLNMKLFIAVTSLCALTIVLLGQAAYLYARESLTKKQHQLLSVNIDLAVKSVDNELYTLVGKAVQLLMDKEFVLMFSKSYPRQPERMNAIFAIRNRLTRALNLDMSRDIEINLYSDNADLHSYVVSPFEQLEEVIGADRASQLASGHVVWHYYAPDDALWLIRKGIGAKTPQSMAAVFVMPGEEIRKVLSTITKAHPDQYCAFMMPEGIIFESGSRPEAISQEALLAAEAQPRQVGAYTLIGKPTWVKQSRIVLAMPATNEELQALRWSYTMSMLLSFLILMPISALTLRSTIRRLTGLLSTLETMDIDEAHQIEYRGRDELSIIISRINGFIRRNATLTRERYEAQQALSDARQRLLSSRLKQQSLELDLLQMQINPHFLYNAFSSIKNSIQLGLNQEELIGVMDAFSSFYRLSLNRGRRVHTVREEIELTRYYIFVQDYIQPGAVRAAFDVDEDALECPCVMFLLQPAVENVYKHAANGARQRIDLLITCEFIRALAEVKLTISDNGRGFAPDQVEASGYGLQNVMDRLQLYYDGRASLSIRSLVGDGAEVTIIIPSNWTPPE